MITLHQLLFGQKKIFGLNFNAEQLFTLGPFVILVFLLFRNPFSDRTLIPNFEPYPDSFHYLTPPMCWLQGKGWSICFEYGSVKPSVPPLYSLVNLPMLVIFRDPRAFYFTNVFLTFATLSLLYWLLKRLKVNAWLIPLPLLLYVLNPYVYWLPTLAMAELLLLPLFLIGLILFTFPVNRRWIVLAGLVASSFAATKYAAVPITVVFGLGYAWKVFPQSSSLMQRIKQEFLLATIAGLMLMGVFGQVIFKEMAYQRTKVVELNPIVTEVATTTSTPGWFSWQYLPEHFPRYLQLLIGQSLPFLWRTDPLLPSLIAWIGIAGIIWGMKKTRQRFLLLVIVGSILAQIIFMSRFYTLDARYLIVALLVIYVGVGLCLHQLAEQLRLRPNQIAVGAIILAIACLGLHATPLKAQIGLNLKYTETPWYYLSIVQLNQVFPKSIQPKPIVVTAVPSMLINFYSNGNYRVMPLSDDHDLHDEKKKMFGDHDYADLIKLYAELLNQGEALYVMNYGIGNVAQRNQDWQKFKNSFELELVKEGCHNLCNVWRVKSFDQTPGN